MSKISLNINSIDISVPAGTTITEAALEVGIKIPTLCYHPDQEIKANCRVCVVEVEGYKNLLPACATKVTEGMIVKTNVPRVIEARRTILELMLARHPQDCLNCVRTGTCELQLLANEYNIRPDRFEREDRALPLDYSTPALIRDPNKCLLCGRCIEVCTTVQTVNALGLAHRSYDTQVVPSIGQDLFESPCVMCGQCLHACPVGSIIGREQIDDFLAAVADPNKVIVTQIAPAVRLALAEELGQEPGALPMEQLVAGLRHLGFDYVLNTNFAADVTIWEEGAELLQRLQQKGPLPMFTSCCPAWVRFCEIFYPTYLDHLSTCKSPQQMFGVLVKTYWAEKMNIDPDNIYSVSIMPCLAKKYEALRPEMTDYSDVDLVITTRELGRLFRMAGLNPAKLEGSLFDAWMGEYTGAAVLFGATGGVMEAALRTIYEQVTKQELDKVEFTDVRGFEEIREAVIDLDGTHINVAVAHSLANARKLMEQVQNGDSPYHFIEVMTCPGGCIGGGGQPLTSCNQQRTRRMEALYHEDKELPVRKSHLNSEVKMLYDEFLGQPLGPKSHELLHTHYNVKRKNT